MPPSTFDRQFNCRQFASTYGELSVNCFRISPNCLQLAPIPSVDLLIGCVIGLKPVL